MELGSEYNLSLSELKKSENNLFSYLSMFPNAIFLDSGRSAIRYLSCQLNEQDEILLPEYICESVINCFRKDKISFYSISPDFIIDVDDLQRKITPNTKVIFLMHYFGVVQSEKILFEISKIAEQHNCVILEDVTHCIFTTKKTVGDYVVLSIRKWMPIPNGGVFWAINDKLKIHKLKLKKSTDNDRAYGMVLKDLFLHDVLECKSAYRGIFLECEKHLDEQREIYLLSDFAEYIISCIDVENLVRRRKANYQMLSSLLAKQGILPSLKITDCSCPFSFILRIPRRDDFREFLTANNIFCAVHWPSDGIMENQRQQAVKNSEELISLPIDQRYDQKHMEYLAWVISQYGGDHLF